jgi:hypothetical protein
MKVKIKTKTIRTVMIAAFVTLAPQRLFAADVSTSETPPPVVVPSTEDLGSKFLNLRIKPLGLVFGVFGGELQVALAPWLAMGASIDWYENTTTNATRTVDAYEYELLASIYLTGARFHGGWVVQPGYHYAPTDTSSSNVKNVAHTYDYYLTATIGREWAWQSGFNCHLAIGVASSPNDPARHLDPLAVWQLGFAI